MSPGWAGPAWGEASAATGEDVPLRSRAWAPDACYRADGGRTGDFVVLAASAAGVSHRLVGRRCEDCYSWVLSPAGPGRLAVVVADGVGSAGRGGEGAEIAVRAACDYFANLAAGDGWGLDECEVAVRSASQALHEAGGQLAGEFSTTLVVGLLMARDGGADVALARVGDSSAWALLSGGEAAGGPGAWKELFAGPGDDELQGRPTRALPFGTGGSSQRSQAHLPPASALVLVTDGVGDPLRDGPSTVAPALAEVLSRGPSGALSPLDLARAADFSRRGCGDDRTVLAVWPLAHD